MKIKKILSVLLVFILVFATVGTAFAQDEGPNDPDAGDVDDGDDQDGGDDGDGEGGHDGDWTHPIVALFQAYFDSLNADDGEDTGDGEGNGESNGDDCLGDDCDTGGGEMSFGEQIGAYHEDGIGFGLLANLLALTELSQANCSAGDGEGSEPTDSEGETACGASLDELVESFKSGNGFSQLYKDYGKPDEHGVGFIHKAVDDSNGRGKSSSYEEGDEVWVIYDEDSDEWDWAEEGDEGAVMATVISVTDNGDGTQTYELAVEGQAESIFLTVRTKGGKPDKPGKSSSSYEEGDEVWVAYDEDSDEWDWAEEGDEGAVMATVIDVTDNGDGTQTYELVVEGQAGSIFLTIEEGHGKPDKPGKSDKQGKGKPDNPGNKPDKDN